MNGWDDVTPAQEAALQRALVRIDAEGLNDKPRFTDVRHPWWRLRPPALMTPAEHFVRDAQVRVRSRKAAQRCDAILREELAKEFP